LVGVLTLAACGPKSIEVRTRQAERKSDEAAQALERAQKAADALDPAAMHAALQEARRALADPDIGLYPESGMHQDRYQELAATEGKVRAAREQRDLEAQLEAARSSLVPVAQAVGEGVDGLDPASASLEQVAALEARAKELQERVTAQQPLFAKGADFKDWAEHQLRKSERGLEVVGRAKAAIAFREGPVAAWGEAKAKREEARRVKGPGEKVSALEGAREALERCSAGAQAAKKDAFLSGLSFPAGAQRVTVAKLTKACQALDTSVTRELKRAREARKKAEAAEKKRAAAAEKRRLAAERKAGKKKQ
jgi:hypothetical protein